MPRAQTACFTVKDDMPRNAAYVPPQTVNDNRTALDEIMAKGRTKKRQERWVVLGGLLMQGERNLSYEGIRELAGYHADKSALPSGYSTARPPHVSEPVVKRR